MEISNTPPAATGVKPSSLPTNDHDDAFTIQDNVTQNAKIYKLNSGGQLGKQSSSS